VQNFVCTLMLGIWTISFAGLGTIANATATSDEPTAEPELEAIIVTAQKREERLQDVPISVSVLQSQDLIRLRYTTTEDLQYLVPSLNYTTQVGFADPFLRGIGTDINLPGSDPDVATYQDGVFLANDQSVITSLLGTERVEVLVGPQGTLYGRNAVGGAINVITMTPTDVPDADLTVGTGNYHRYEGAGHVSGPLAANLDGGLYFAADQEDSYYQSQTPTTARSYAGVTPSHESRWGVRGKLVFEEGPLKLTGSLEHSENKSMEQGVFHNIQPNGLGVELGAPFNTRPYYSTADGAEGVNGESTLAILREEYDLGGPRLLGISAYRRFDSSFATDDDGTSAPVAELLAISDFSTHYSQEIQLLSPTSSRVQWIVGLYGYHERAGYYPTGLQTDILLEPLLGPGSWLEEIDGIVNTTSWAVFSQATLPLSTALRLTIGGRFSEDRKELVSSSTDFVQIVGGSAVPPVLMRTLYPDREANWTNFSPKITLDYKIADTMFYATWSQGYKPGVFNIVAPTAPGPVNPEKLNSFEIGTKSEFFGRRLQLNNSAYYYDFKDIQIQTVVANLGGLDVLANGAEAEAYGLESAFEAQLTQAFKISGSAAWTHGRYTSFPSLATFNVTPGGNTQVVVDATGNQMQRDPTWVANAGVEYNKVLPGGSTLLLSGDWYYNGGFYWEAANRLREPSYSLLNASAAWSPNKAWTLTVWGKNLADRLYDANLEYSNFATLQTLAPPRTFGITMRHKFF
jgi:iron complex outermembrane recepter protein